MNNTFIVIYILVLMLLMYFAGYVVGGLKGRSEGLRDAKKVVDDHFKEEIDRIKT